MTAFSGVQGENGWEWGYRNLTADGGAQDYDAQADFIAFPGDTWNGTKWDLSGGAPWTELGKEATHPNGSNNAGNGGGLHWTVRRWTAGAMMSGSGQAGGTALACPRDQPRRHRGYRCPAHQRHTGGFSRD